MAESTKIEVRLVRCPKCENLLPEPKDCSFFKCGGCGTILCAKNKNREADLLSDNNRAKETEVNLNCNSREEEEESDSDASLKHQRETLDNVETQSGLDRFKKRRNDSEDFFKFSGSNYFQESLSSDEAIKQDRAALLRKLDKLKEQAIPSFENPTSRFFSSRKHGSGSYYHHYQEPKPPCNPAAYREPLGFPMHERAHPHYSRQYIGNNGHDYACSCSYDPYHRASGSVIPPSGLPDALGFYHHERNIAFGSSLHSPRALSRVHRLPKVLSSPRVIRPVAGGAPFLTCKNCFKLLKLPDSVTRKQQKLRCGSCSCLIEFSFRDNKLILSTNPASVRKAETRSKLHYEFDSIYKGPEDDDLSNDPVSIILEKAQEMQIADSEDEEELCSESSTVKTLTTSDSPLRENFDYSSSINVRNQSFRAVAIEIDESFNESEVSQDSANDENRDDDQVIRRRITKKRSGFTNIVKNLKKSIQSENSNVSINGNPIPERLLKLVEKQAGPIRPGNYWYDYRAGFWGVMGNHCLGILPPFIEELNYPMPENCANGNTSVFVNGRELHQKDLRLLAARGLPRDKDRSYTVYISGRVIDEDTGEELNSLGKLAPTVDKLKRGFGMRVPRRAA